MKRLKHGIYAIVILSLATGLLTCKGAEEIFQQVQQNVEGARASAPAAPSSLQAVARSANQIDLTWTDNSDNEDEFQIQRDSGSGFQAVGSGGADSTAYADRELVAETTYTYRVRAANSVGESAWTDEVTATTGATPKFSVSYDGNESDGGAPPVDPTWYEEGATVTVSGSGTLSRTGHSFTEWNTAPLADGIAYAAAATFVMGTENVTLYAQWALNQYTLSYDLNGGTGTVPAAAQYDYGYEVPTDDGSGTDQTGYAFTGWNTDPNGTGTAVAAGAPFSMPASDETLYAQWVVAPWAHSVTSGAVRSVFNSVAVDTSGNVYAAGLQGGTGLYTYGSGVSVAGTSVENAVLVKYNSSGIAQWARSVTADPGDTSVFYGVGVDGSGNVYAAGSQLSNGTYIYGSGVSVDGSSSTNANAVVVKYNPSGTAQWARSVEAGTGESLFMSIAVDASGNAYAAGSQYGDGAYTYGGLSVSGSFASSGNVVLVKYNTSGHAQWARSVEAGDNLSFFQGVAVDAAGLNVYAAGLQFGPDPYTFGAGVSVAGAHDIINPVLVKYNSSGTAGWARSVTSGASNSVFNGVAVDASGNVYATGSQNGNGSYTYGGSASVSGSAVANNVVLVKFNSSGAAGWARSVTAGASSSSFWDVAVDTSGNIYAAGNQNGTGTCTYATGVNATGTYTGNNVVIVRYDSSGNAQWARSVTAGADDSIFFGAAVDASGHVYAAGYQDGIGSYTYHPDVNVSGASGSKNAVLVKYVE